MICLLSTSFVNYSMRKYEDMITIFLETCGDLSCKNHMELCRDCVKNGSFTGNMLYELLTVE